MFTAARLKAGNRRLRCADAFGDFCLCKTSRGSRFQKGIKEFEFFFQPVIFELHIGACKCAGFQFFMRERL